MRANLAWQLEKKFLNAGSRHTHTHTITAVPQNVASTTLGTSSRRNQLPLFQPMLLCLNTVRKIIEAINVCSEYISTHSKKKKPPPQFHVNSSHFDALTCIICQSLLENFAQISGPPDASLALWFPSLNQTTHNVQPFF